MVTIPLNNSMLLYMSSQATAKQLLLSLDHYHQCFFPLLKCLFHLTKSLPNAPLGRKVGKIRYRLIGDG